MKRSPDGPPFWPGSPLPVERMRWPSSMPAGILISSVFCFLILPWPLQVVQGSGMILPVPWQCGQFCCTLKKPWRICTTPWPWQVEQVLALVPGLAPLPLQVSQSVPGGNADLAFFAGRRFFQVDLHRVGQVGTAVDLSAIALAALATKDVAKDVAEGAGETFKAFAAACATAAHVGVNAGVAVLVVGRFFLRVRQHFVGLFGLFESLFGGLGRVALVAVRVVLHRQLAIRLFDFVV